MIAPVDGFGPLGVTRLTPDIDRTQRWPSGAMATAGPGTAAVAAPAAAVVAAAVPGAAADAVPAAAAVLPHIGLGGTANPRTEGTLMPQPPGSHLLRGVAVIRNQCDHRVRTFIRGASKSEILEAIAEDPLTFVPAFAAVIRAETPAATSS